MVYKNNNLAKMISLFVVHSLVVACSGGISNDERHAKVYEERHPIRLETKQESIEIPINDLEASLSNIDEDKLKSFLYQYNNQSRTNLVITVPETGVKAGTARNMLKEILKVADMIGIQKKSIKIGTYQPLSEANTSVRLHFEKAVAIAPDCSNSWSKNLADSYNNDLSKGHGCATRKNLAAMIVNPVDLTRMPAMGASNAQRRIDVFDKYIQGQSTTASRGAGETASATKQ